MDMNLYEAIKDRRKYLSEKKVKFWIYQVLKALEYMHRNGIFHRDIKPENILLRKNIVKLADLGSCKGMYAKPPFTEYISTRWYRSPECLLTDGCYNYKMDIWGLGCVFFEMLTLTPLFPGNDELDQVNKINQILGSPSDELFEKFVRNSEHRDSFNFEFYKGVGIKKYLGHVSRQCVELIEKMLMYDPDLRWTAKQCINHPYFADYVEQESKTEKRNVMNLNNNESSSFHDDSIQGLNNSNPRLHKLKKASNASGSNIFTNHQKYALNSLNFGNIYGNINISNKNISPNLPKLPEVKLNIYSNENSKEEDSIFKGSKDSGRIGGNENYLLLPKIVMHKKKFWGEFGNFMKSNEFKKLKHNISNHSIEKGLINLNTQYEKKTTLNIRKRIKEIKKKYVSPYSKKTIEENILI